MALDDRLRVPPAERTLLTPAWGSLSLAQGKEHCGPFARSSFPSASMEIIFSNEKTASVIKLTTKILLIFSPLLEAFSFFSITSVQKE